ncbi:HAMP domain-containing histidine kinase [Candidatus Beckwithbacteria bacterium]|nr:HAMP domain-containing histidine kinase [Candidatus Beckwithbacteria bacterium]
MFQSERIKLTAYYTLIIFLISGTISAAIYFRTTSIIQSEYQRIERRFQHQTEMDLPPDFVPPTGPHFLPEDLESAQHNLLIQLLLINSAIVVLVAGAGYFLSGKTLQPIYLSLEEQKRFVADAAHELRTPITALKTSLEVNLMNKKLSPQTREILQENLDDVAGLESLSESLLKLSRVDGNHLQIEEVVIAPLVEQVVKQLSPLAKAKKITLKIQRIPRTITIKSDKAVLTELIQIFVDNAIKYSKKNGKVWIKAKADTKELTFTIKDNGVGIAKHHLPHIFDRFYRVDSARTKIDSNGYGLGLSVAKKIVGQLNGEIQVDSQLDKGTKFSITLPCKR